MNHLKERLKATCFNGHTLPYSVYSAVADQHLLNVPIVKPLLICVLEGRKELGRDQNAVCEAGDFIFLANTPNIDMRNISQGASYQALLVEFDYQDFSAFHRGSTPVQPYFCGPMPPLLETALEQFVQWAPLVPENLWSLRKQELLQLLFHAGYEQVSAIAEPPSLTHRVEQLISARITDALSATDVANLLAMSESTLRRKLAAEQSHFQAIKDRVQLGYGLHLLQSTAMPIGLVAEQCGYQSQSRFTDKFKALFGLTPSALRKTHMRETGE